MLGGCNRRGFQSFEQLRFKTLQLFIPNSKRLGGYTQWVHFFFRKSTCHQEDFFKTDHFNIRFKTLLLFIPNSKRLGGYTQWVHFFLQKSAHHSEDFFRTGIFKQHKNSRPSNFLFQIARGSGATLSECTFSFKKAHITQKTSSRQTNSRPHNKKNPDRAISEFFLIKNPGTCFEALRRRIRAISRQDPPAPCSK